MKTVEVSNDALDRSLDRFSGVSRSRDRLFQKTLRKSPISKISLPPAPQKVSASVGDVRVISGLAVRPYLPRVMPELQRSFVYRPRRFGETPIHSRRFGPSNFWAGTPLERSPSVGDVKVFDADELFSGWDEIGFAWNLRNQTLDVYATRNGQTWKVHFSTRRLVTLFNRGLKDAGSKRFIRYPKGRRPTVGWDLFQEIGRLGEAIGTKMIEPAVRDVGKAIDTVANNPVVQGVVTGLAMIPPLTAIGGPALAALSVAKGVKSAGDVIGGVVDAAKTGLDFDKAVSIVSNVTGAIPGLPPAAKGIMQGALGAAGLGSKLLGGSKPLALVAQSVSGMTPAGISEQLQNLAREAQEGGYAIPSGMLEGLDQLMKVALPGTKLPQVVLTETPEGRKTLGLKTAGGSDVPYMQAAQYLGDLVKQELAKPRGLDAELKRANINPNLIRAAQGPVAVVPKPKRVKWTPPKTMAMKTGAPTGPALPPGSVSIAKGPSVIDRVNQLPDAIKAQFVGIMNLSGVTPVELAKYPLDRTIYTTIAKFKNFQRLRQTLDNHPQFKSQLLSAEQALMRR